MPLLHTSMLLLMLCQAIFYLRLFRALAKFFAIFALAFVDVIPFILVFFLINAFMIMLFHVLGATFDDGGNYKMKSDDDPEAYDTNFNDYPYVNYAGVSVMSAIRNSIGDL